MRRPLLILLLLVVAGLGLAARLEIWYQNWTISRGAGASMLAVMMGDSRRMFANHFLAKADAYFHAGRYPSIFDNTPVCTEIHTGGETEEHDHAPEPARSGTKEPAAPAGAPTGSHDDDDHDHDHDHDAPPLDWIDRLGRHFYASGHTHLEGGDEREILPWMRLAAETDPHKVEIYTLTAYWLRARLGKYKEAEQFLREGLRNNPHSPEILHELGIIYFKNYHDPTRARNLWELAYQRWTEQEADKPEPDLTLLRMIVTYLTHLETTANNIPRALFWMEIQKKTSPNPEVTQREIDALRKTASAPAPTNAPPARP